MIFTSIDFFLFLIPTFLLFYLIPSRFRNYFLIIVSLIFYAFAKVEYTILIILLVILNYLIGLGINNNSTRRDGYLYLSLFINLGVLVFYKYWNFLVSNLFQLLGWFHLNTTPMPLLDVILPLGLSYYTFQNIGYILDVYRGTIKAERNIFNFGLFSLFFPKLLVGPIERANSLLPQLKKRITFQQENIIEGSKQIAWGLFKKLVVANRISIYHDAVMSSLASQSGGTILFASILYTFQVYADFSGYTDLALGTGKLFGYDLMQNFRRPLLARNVSDFWRRWHISLSSWVNDYIFNPILFKRRDWGKWGIFYALVVSFVVIGIWHGASWNYVVFGLLQAIALIYETITKKIRKKVSKKTKQIFYDSLSITMTFIFITFSLIIFQSPTLKESIGIIEGIFSHHGKLFIDKPTELLFMLIGCFIIIFSDLQAEFKIFQFTFFSNKNWVIQQISFALLLIYILIAGVFDGGQFIYLAF